MIRRQALMGSEYEFQELLTLDCQTRTAAASSVFTRTGNYFQNEKATRQLGSLFFQGRIVPTEVSSIETFCGNLMSLKSTVSSKICDLNSLIFNNLHRVSKSQQTGPKWAEFAFLER